MEYKISQTLARFKVAGFDSDYFPEYLTGNDINDVILILSLQRSPSTLKILYFGTYSGISMDFLFGSISDNFVFIATFQYPPNTKCAHRALQICQLHIGAYLRSADVVVLLHNH